MCGIAGWQFSPRFNPSPSFVAILASYLATGMDRRGGDSFGVAKLNRTGQVKLWKGLGTAIGHLDVEAAKTPQFMLHTRKRTHGAISIENAHPLTHDHIVGCHNGIVSNHDDLNEKYKRDFELDSRHIFEHIAKGADLREIDVYGAISYIDLNKPNVINLCRLSSGGDLEAFGIGTEHADDPNLAGVVYASTPFCIEDALKVLRIPYFHYNKLEAKRHYYIKDGRLMVLNGREGEMPFGLKPYHERKVYGFVRRAVGGFNEEANEFGFKLCKPCKKLRKSEGSNFNARQLCRTCWDRWYKVAFGRTPEEAAKEYARTQLSKGEDIMCVKMCGRVGTLVCEKNLHYCVDCRIAEASKKNGPNLSVVPPHPALMKPGSDGSCVEGELLEELSGRGYCSPLGSSIPLELEQWDLCFWCTTECKSRKKFSVAELCGGCKAKWEGMIYDLRAMSKAERCLFRQVLPCASCRIVPTFGWSMEEAFDKDGEQVAMCSRCAGRCVVCGENNPKKLFAATKEGEMIPYCKVCFNNKNRLVPLGGKSATAGTNH